MAIKQFFWAPSKFRKIANFKLVFLILHSKSKDEIEVFENGVLVVEDGVVTKLCHRHEMDNGELQNCRLVELGDRILTTPIGLNFESRSELGNYRNQRGIAFRGLLIRMLTHLNILIAVSPNPRSGSINSS